MAYVAPTTRADGYVVTATVWNSDVVDNPIALKALIDALTASEQTTTATGGQDNFAPSAGYTINIRCTGAAPVFTGFSGGTAGRVLYLHCLGTSLKVTNEATSTAANQIICDSTNGQIVGANGVIMLVYDGTTSRWRASLLNAGIPVAFTPTIGGSGGQSGQAYTTQIGRYVQRGRQVQAWVNIVLSTLGTITTNAQIQSLPITSQNTTGLISTLAVGTWANFNTTITFLSGVLDANATAVTLRHIAGVAAASTFPVLQADLAATTQIVGEITYPID
jgi:hypothetical protein